MARLFVGNLTDDVSTEDLRCAFSAFGPLKDCWVATKKQSGFGFVEYYNTSHAGKALNSMNGGSMGGRRIKVNFARPKKDGETEVENRTCHECGNAGHVKPDCPMLTSYTARPKIGKAQVENRTCYKCGKKGHIKADCLMLNIASSVKFPDHWPQNCKMGQKITVTQNVCERLTRNFEKSIGLSTVNVIKIEEICNTEFYERYEVKKKNLKTKLSNTIREMLLYHGTLPEIIDPICAQNFDSRLSGKNATAYGKGSYFATNASYSHNYTDADSNGIRYMFLANVLVGKYALGNSSMTRPPPLPSSPRSHDLYDSCVNDIHNPSIFVVFERDQCYPKYLISYKIGNINTTAAHITQRNYSTISQPYSTRDIVTTYTPHKFQYYNTTNNTQSNNSTPAKATYTHQTYQSYSPPTQRSSSPTYTYPSNTNHGGQRKKKNSCVIL